MMMRTLKQRFLVTVVATTLAALMGAGAGYLLGCTISLYLAENNLQVYAMRIVRRADDSSAAAAAMLVTLNASGYDYCSDEEIAYFRDLIFRSEYLKDAGHTRNGKIQCSATMGRLKRPLALPASGILQPGGTTVYKNLSPPAAGDLNWLGVQRGDSYVVMSAYILKHMEALPLHYAITAFDSPDHKANLSLSVLPGVQAKDLTQVGPFRQNHTLYDTRCSTRFFYCATAYVSIADALREERNHIAATSVMGGVIGSLFGFLCSLFYSRSRSMERQLRRAVAKDDLQVAYQPIVELDGGRIVGAEALARWTDEDGFAVSPDIFIKIAEQFGFVGEITKLVVRHALRDFGAILRSDPGFHLSINVAASDLSDAEFLPMLDLALKQAGVAPQGLTIEITEGSTARHEVAMETIRVLRERGHRVHIDDFGTGYSSLAYLHDLAVDAIKIDKAFIQAIGTEAVTVGILPQILAMAQALNLQVIAEGIETGEQAVYFGNAEKPILGQGWLFGRPIPPVEFHRLLTSEKIQIATHTTQD